MHKSQALLVLIAAFVSGIFLGSFWEISKSGLMIITIIGLVILCLSSYQGTFGQTEEGIKKRKIGFIIGCGILTLNFGIYHFNSFYSQHSYLLEFADREAKDQGVDIILRGYSVGEFNKTKLGASFPFRVKQIVVGERVIPADEKILINTDILPRYSYGDILKVKASINRPKNFEDFDYISYLKKDGIQVIVSKAEIQKDEKLKLGFWESKKLLVYKGIFKVKDKFENAINQAVAEPNAAYLNGVLTGTKRNITDDLKSDFQLTGTSHILAISGYNITIISTVLLSILVFFTRRRVAFGVSVILIIVFTILTGASASVVRASIMALILMFASSYGRLSDIKIALVLAGVVMLLLNPMLLRFDVGFQLSFLALLGLISINPILNDSTEKWWKDGIIKEILTATLSAQIMVAPILVFYFHSLSIISPLVNLLVLPVVPVVMFLGAMTGVVGMASSFLGKVVGALAWAASQYQLKVIHWFASLSFASIDFQLSWIAVAASYILIFGVVWYVNRVKKISTKDKY
jgi:competence protein ComEC